MEINRIEFSDLGIPIAIYEPAPAGKLALLERVHESSIGQAARTLLDLRQTWESSTQEERKDLVHIML